MISVLVYVGIHNATEAPEFEEVSFRISFSRKELQEGWDPLLAVPTTVGILDGEV
jgi:hypothetical protein